MADVTTKITFNADTGSVDKAVSKMGADLRKIEKDAQLAQKGIADMFKGEAFESAASKFAGVQQAVDKYIKTMSRNTTVKQELKATTVVATELEAAWRKMSDAEKQSAEGQELRSTIDELISKAGDLKDTMGDVSGAISKVASDSRALDVAVQGLGVLSAGAQVAAGAMTVMGVEQEKVAEIQQKLTSLIAITNGLKTIENALQKESALMMALHAAKTKIATLAQMGFNNAVKANPLGALLTVITAVAAATAYFVVKANEATDAEKGLANAVKDGIKAMGEGAKKEAEVSLELERYRITVENFNGTAEEEAKLVDELNQKYGDSMGRYQDLNKWKTVLAENSEYYIKMLVAEAKAAALASAYGEIYRKQVTGEISYSEAQSQMDALHKDWMRVIDDVQFYKSMLKIATNISGGSTAATQTKKSQGSKSSSKGNKNDKKEAPAPMGSDDWYREEISKLEKELGQTSASADPKRYKELVGQIGSLKISMEYFDNKAKGIDPFAAFSPTKAAGLVVSLDTANMAVPKFVQNLETLEDRLKKVGDAGRSISNIMSNMGAAVGGSAGEWLKYGANVVQSCTQAYQTIVKLIPALEAQAIAEAAAQASELGPLGWLSIGAAVASVIAAFASMPAFANGGIVGGNDHSDGILARVSSGEMILNQGQQRNLFNMINSGGGKQVEFVIRGRDLVGVERNYSSKMSKVK